MAAATSARRSARLLREAEGLKNAIVFCNRKRDVAIVHKSLEKHGFPVGALHGDMDQSARMASLDAFKNGAVDILVCSDVAARGLDIPDVSHVFNFDVPTHSEDYVHRIGRTGRAGRSGHSYTIVTSDDGKYIAQIEDLIKKQIDWHGPRVNELGEPQYVERDRERASRSNDRPRRSGRGERGRPERGPRPDRAAHAHSEPDPAAERTERIHAAVRHPGEGRNDHAERPHRERPHRAERPERAPRAEQPARTQRMTFFRERRRRATSTGRGAAAGLTMTLRSSASATMCRASCCAP